VVFGPAAFERRDEVQDADGSARVVRHRFGLRAGRYVRGIDQTRQRSTRSAAILQPLCTSGSLAAQPFAGATQPILSDEEVGE
jgi:hypothetical protein